MIPDRIERKLIILLQRDGRAPLTFLGRELGMSHVGVKKRIEKLISKGLIKVRADLSSRGYVYAIVLSELEGYDYFKEVARRFRECPRLIFLAPLIGGMNYIAIMAFEDINVLEACMGSCIIRTLKGVRRSDVYVARDVIVPDFIPLNIVEPKKEEAPCGAKCSTCTLYLEGKCPACPATKYYRPKYGSSTSNSDR